MRMRSSPKVIIKKLIKIFNAGRPGPNPLKVRDMANDGGSDWIRPGIRVNVKDKGLEGTVRFFGTTEFAPGKWAGVELDEPKGKNNGNVKGKVDYKYTYVSICVFVFQFVFFLVLFRMPRATWLVCSYWSN